MTIEPDLRQLINDIGKTLTLRKPATETYDPDTGLTSTASGFSPTDLDELKLWIDPSDTATITLSGNEATVIDDKSGGTDAARITTGADSGVRTINNNNVLDFASGEAYSINVSHVNGVEGFMVLEFDNISTRNFIRDTNNTNTIRAYTDVTGKLVLDLQNYNLTGTTVLSTGTVYIVYFKVSEAGAELRLDGELEASSEDDPGFTTAWDVFGGTSFGFDGGMGDVLGFDATLSVSEINKVGDYLRDKYNGTWENIPDDTEVKGMVLNYRDGQFDGDIIQRGDRKIVLRASDSVVPEVQDLVIDGSDNYRIVNVRQIEQAGTDLVYICQGRI